MEAIGLYPEIAGVQAFLERMKQGGIQPDTTTINPHAVYWRKCKPE
jgi:hypothetical protein